MLIQLYRISVRLSVGILPNSRRGGEARGKRAGREATRSDPEEGGEAAGTRRGGEQDYQEKGWIKRRRLQSQQVNVVRRCYRLYCDGKWD